MAILQTNIQSQSVTTVWNDVDRHLSTTAYTASADVLVVRLMGAAADPAAITYNGVALTLQVSENDGDQGDTKIYHLLSAASGANNLVIDTGGQSRTWRMVISALSGVDTGTAATTATDSGYKGTLSCAPVTVVDGFVVDAICIWDTFTAVAGSGQTQTTTLEAATTNYTTYTSSETATTTSTTMDWALTGADNRVSQAAIAYSPSASGPTITNVNTTNVVQVLDTPVVTGTSFLATGGTQAWGGVSVGFSSWADTSITSTAITRGDLAYNTNYDWIVTDNLAAASTAQSVQLAIETGYQFVTLSSPIIVLVGGYRTSLCYGSVPDCVTGDQLRAPTTTNEGKALTINVDGTFSIAAAGNTEQTFSFEVWDANAATNDKWSASTAVVVNGVIVGGGGILRNVLRSPLKNILRNVLK